MVFLVGEVMILPVSSVYAAEQLLYNWKTQEELQKEL
jgi:hypothetical protein